MNIARRLREPRILRCVCASLAVLLGGIVAYAWCKSGQERSIVYLCQSRLRGIAEALRIYCDENGSYPISLDTLIAAGDSTMRNCQCPMQSHAIDEFPDYAYVSGLSTQDPGCWPVAFDLAENHGNGTRNVIANSGTVHLIGEKEFGRMMETFCIEYRREKGCDPVIVYPGKSVEP